ncbi:PBSX family phage terminase large subunit [Helicobacter aurati]|uniref:PBSX family phage terminase large subunit n=1 Tax=Helicobacter aurati TaxID=137778 RepID=A0A3D8IYQ9_9HELI|nr:PBSX family phage terminase large subunit [Helicobacter aurati]RDU70409.1 PBSX family phage terminase large subunit [Helicobacter aurati]
MNIRISSKFKDLFNGKLSLYRILCFYGGRGGGKTEAISDYALLQCITKSNINFYCARNIKESKDNSLVNVFNTKIKQYNLSELIYSKSSNKISFSNGSNIIFVGVSKITVDNIRSVYNANYFWFEECHKIENEVMEVLIPSVRVREFENFTKDIKAQIILTFNPQNKTDYVYSQYVLNRCNNDYFKTIKINYKDNPFFPREMELDRIQDLNTKPRHVYRHIWEGDTKQEQATLIDITKIGMYDNAIKYNYKRIYITMDTAYNKTTYSDYSVIALFGMLDNELHILRIMRGKWEFGELSENLKYMYNYCIETYKRSVNVIIIEEKSSGISLIQELRKLTNFNIKSVKPNTDKVARLHKVLHLINILRIPLQKDSLNSWVDITLNELSEFRGDMKHEHDDIVDCIVYGLDYYNNYNSKPNYAALSKKLFNY